MTARQVEKEYERRTQKKDKWKTETKRMGEWHRGVQIKKGTGQASRDTLKGMP